MDRDASQRHLVRVGLAAAQHGERDLGADGAAQQPLALVQRHVPRGLAVDGADVVAGVQTGLAGRRAVSGRHDAQVVLPGQREAGGAGHRSGLGALEHGDLGCVEVRAVGVETLRQPEHRAVQHRVGVGFFDIAAEDQRHDVVEDAQVRVGARRRALLAQQTPDQREHHERSRQDEHEETGTSGHYVTPDA